MDANEIRRRLEAMGAAMDYILLVPKERNVPDLRREGRYNLVETDDGWTVCSYERGAFNERAFTDLDEACREITTRAQRSVDQRRRHQAKLDAKRRSERG